METNREIKTLQVNAAEYEEWLDENKPIILTEMIDACEYLVLNELENTTVLKLLVDSSLGKMMQVFKVYKEHLSVGLEKVMQSCIKYEEYETAQRVKELQEYLQEHDI